MNKIKVVITRAIALMLAIVLLCSTNISAFASSSASSAIDTKKHDNYRTFAEYMDTGSTAGIVRKNIMQTYLKQGETVYFGSSVYDSQFDATRKLTGSPKADIAVRYPDGTDHGFDNLQYGIGFIKSDAQVKAGPKITAEDYADTNSKKYIPQTFEAPMSGIYEFAFQSKTGAQKSVDTSGSKVNETAEENDAVVKQAEAGVAFWDITVIGRDGKVITGRTYSDFLALTTGAVKFPVSAEYYVVTKDGYIYKVTLDHIQPYGFIFFSNNQGLTTTGLTPSSIYHSVYDRDNNMKYLETDSLVTFHFPNTKDTDIAQTNMIFYGEPSPDLKGILYNDPVEPQGITEVFFKGHEDGKTYYTQGGTFSFESHGASSVSLVIDFSESIKGVLEDPSTDNHIKGAIRDYYKEGGTGIVEINGATTDGWNEFIWDGRDDNNVQMPVGVYTAEHLHVTAHPKAGEVHFPLLDVEGSVDGLEIERLNGDHGRDEDDADDSRYDIYYNNSPLTRYHTIEGYAAPEKENKAVNIGSGKNYYVLSDGTRSHSNGGSGTNKDNYVSFFNATYTSNGITYTNNQTTNVTSLIRNENFVAHRYDENGNRVDENGNIISDDDASYTEEPEFIHSPINSHTTRMKFATDNSTYGGGDQAAIDIWTYHESDSQTKVSFHSEIEIIPNDTVGKIKGRVFYDNDKNKAYNEPAGDYPLKDILVTLVDINGNPIQVTNDIGEPITDQDDNPVYYTATTDAYGYYNFNGVYYGGEGQSKDFYIKVLLTDAQKNAYEQCTTTNDLCKSSTSQKVTLNDSNRDTGAEFKDIGYYSPPTKYSELTVMKTWNSNVDNQLDKVIINLYQVDPKNSAKKSLVGTETLSSNNSWKYTFYNMNKAYKYYVEEYMEDPSGGDDMLIATSEARSIDEFKDINVTYSTTSDIDAKTPYDASFVFNPNIVGPTISITNSAAEDNYKVVFHTNEYGYSDELNVDDIYRTYRRSSYVNADDYMLNDNTYDINAFYDIPHREDYVFTGWYYEPSFSDTSKPLKWNKDTFTGVDATDNDGDKYSIENKAYHIYAHWVPVGTVTKCDEKIGTDNIYGGFDLFGVQIRNYRFDPNYDDGDTFYGYKKEMQGLRFVTSIRNGLLEAVNKAYDIDAGQEFFDYENTKKYSHEPERQNINYGYVTASQSNWDLFVKNYGEQYYAEDELKYNATNVNGEKTSKYFKFVKNVQCTSAVGPNYIDDDHIDKENAYNSETSILDHRNFEEYRIMSYVVTYNELTDSNNMARNVIARPYLKYIDCNGLERVFYSNYKGKSSLGKGCLVSYDYAYQNIKDGLDEVLQKVINPSLDQSQIG